MKTAEQNKQEVINYLTKTSIHTFLKPKATFKWGDHNKPGYYEYDFENGTYFKVLNQDDKWVYIEDDKIKNLDIDYLLKYGGNAKCFIKKRLFLNKNMKSVRNNKFVQSKIDDVLKSKL